MYPSLYQLSLAFSLLTTVLASPAVGDDATATSSVNGGAMAVPWQGPLAAKPTLLPTVHWDQDVQDISSLAPSNATNLYYSVDGAGDSQTEHLFANLSTVLGYQAVVLSHTNLIKSIDCGTGNILMDFVSAQPFNYAVETWAGTNGLVLATYTPGCGNDTSQHSFWLIDHVQPQSGTHKVLATVKQQLDINDALQDVDFSWGKYYPQTATIGLTTTQKRGSGTQTDISRRDLTKTANINIARANNATSPWGPAVLMFSTDIRQKEDISLYCVDCGFRSHVLIQGRAKWSLIHWQVTELSAEIAASDMHAELQLGLVAGLTYSKVKSGTLLNVPIPDLGFQVKGILEAGLFATLDAVVDMKINASGSVLFGMQMDAPNGFRRTIDIHDADKNSNQPDVSFAPQWSKTPVKYNGNITATVGFSLPIGLNFGVVIHNMGFNRNFSLTETPGISATVSVAGGNTGNKTNKAVAGCNNGLGWEIDAANNIGLNLLGLKSWILESNKWPKLVSGCVKF